MLRICRTPECSRQRSCQKHNEIGEKIYLQIERELKYRKIDNWKLKWIKYTEILAYSPFTCSPFWLDLGKSSVECKKAVKILEPSHVSVSWEDIDCPMGYVLEIVYVVLEWQQCHII